MPTLIDTSLWVDFTRARSPRSLKRFIARYILDPDAHIADPIVFEVLRHASAIEASYLSQQFQTLPFLPTPSSIWTDAISLGQSCRNRNITVNSMDLLIASVALNHGAELITFDADFQKIATASNLRVKLLQRSIP
jgi:predicted nucleic acid-binding protein